MKGNKPTLILLRTLSAILHRGDFPAHKRVALMQLALDRSGVCGLCGKSREASCCPECGITVCQPCGETCYPDITCCERAAVLVETLGGTSVAP